MTKVRASSVKPKIQKGDFAKKKVKVGRKVKRANLTEIKVKSRRIIVPLQNQGAEEGETGREAINRVIKQLHHYSESTRLNALHRVKDMLNTGSNIESFVTLVLPEVVELLFNDEKETRSVVTDVVSLMFTKYPPDAFLSVVSVTITYICSGLTNLHKGIRKDSLVLLKVMAQKCPSLLVPYLDKIVRHTLLLLTDSFQSVSVPLMQQQGAVALSTTQVQGSNGTGAKSIKPTMFILILEVLAALLEYSPEKAKRGNRTAANQSAQLDFQFQAGFPSNGALLLSSFASSGGGRQLVTSGSDGAATLSASLLQDTLSSIGAVWQNLVINSSAVAMDSISSLHSSARILLSIARVIGQNHLERSARLGLWRSYQDILVRLFWNFPHTCIEATLAPAGSEKDRQGRHLIAQLDIALCEIAFVYISNLSFDAINEDVDSIRDAATAFLLQILSAHTETVASAVGMQKAASEAEKLATVKIFRSFKLMMSRNTTAALMELLQLLGQLFAALARIPSSDKRSFAYLSGPASECLCSIVHRVHEELGDDYSEPLYVILVESVSTATDLALSATWDQTNLLGKLIRAMLLLTQGNALAGNFTSPALSTALTGLCQVYESIWVKSAEPAEDEGQMGSVFRNVYSAFSEESKHQLLDIYMYAPFDDFFNVSALISEYFAQSKTVTLQEQSYFLRILFERRQKLPLLDVVDLLFSSLQLFIESHSAEEVPSWKSRWLVHEVADVLSWMASSEAPEKVVHFLAESVQELVNLSTSGQEGSAVSAVNAMYWRQSAALVLVRKLLVPWELQNGCHSQGKQSSDEAADTNHAAQAQAVQKLISWAAAVTSAMLQCEHSQEAHIEFVTTSTAALMGLQVDQQQASAPAASPVTHHFVLYQTILRTVVEAVTVLPGTAQGLQVRENVLRNLHTVMQCRQFNDEIFVKCRPELVACVEAVSKVAVAEAALKNKQDLVQNLATDILAFF